MEKSKTTDELFSKFKLDIADSSIFEAFSRGIKLSKINAKLKLAIDPALLLGKLQQHGLVKIVYDPSLDEEPLVQLTEKGKQEAIELLFSGDLKLRTTEKIDDQKPSLGCEKPGKN